jgi:hypothetical protein
MEWNCWAASETIGLPICSPSFNPKHHHQSYIPHPAGAIFPKNNFPQKFTLHNAALMMIIRITHRCEHFLQALGKEGIS